MDELLNKTDSDYSMEIYLNRNFDNDKRVVDLLRLQSNLIPYNVIPNNKYNKKTIAYNTIQYTIILYNKNTNIIRVIRMDLVLLDLYTVSKMLD